MTIDPALPLHELKKGQEVLTATRTITRDALVRYAGASGDFNPIHYNDTAAQDAGLPGVIAHGMLTMGLAISPVVQWLGGPERIRSYTTRFTNPVVVPARGSVELQVRVVIGAIDADAGTVRLDIDATVDGDAVLGRARAVVASASSPAEPAA